MNEQLAEPVVTLRLDVIAEKFAQVLTIFWLLIVVIMDFVAELPVEARFDKKHERHTCESNDNT